MQMAIGASKELGKNHLTVSRTVETGVLWPQFSRSKRKPLMNFIARLFVFLALIGTCSFCDAADPPCAARAIDRAKQLVTFHSGPDDRMTIDKTVKELPSMRNPEDPKQKFEVLEIWGYIYKGRYRMRFIYYNSPATSCLLMGEEILEYARM
jgi:hypothetical protein